jgi:CheY-like chemotaxis protein
MPKVLIVDDLESNRYVLKVLFKLFGADANIQILEASSGVSSIELVRAEKPDLILMDLKMEREESGIDAVRLIRSLKDFQHTPIWAVTAQAMEGYDGQESDRDRCIAAGFSNYFTKPVSQSAMLSEISTTLGIPIPERVRKRMEDWS